MATEAYSLEGGRVLNIGKRGRLLARLDIKGQNLIKGVQLEGLRVLGDPSSFANRYYLQGADELIYMDAVASLYGRNHLSDILSDAVKNIFVPLTAGGGIRSVEDAGAVLRAGADKVAVNTAAVKNPGLVDGISQTFGSQCMVLSVEAKMMREGGWEVYVDNGREPTGFDVISWVKEAVKRGAGEILLTSIDREGTRKGFDLDLLQAVTGVVDVPVIASGGLGTANDAVDAFNIGDVDAVAIADCLHYQRLTIPEVKDACHLAGLTVRRL